MDEEREMVLRMLKDGKISVEEADALLQELTEQRREDGPEEAASPRPELPDLREELRTVFKGLVESFPKDVVREVTRAREAWRPGFFNVVRGLRDLVEGRAEVSADEPMASGELLDLANVWGDVKLTASPDGWLRVRAVKRVWGPTAEDAQGQAEELRVPVTRVAGGVSVTVDRPEGRRARVDFEVAVPAGVSVRLDVAKGDVRLDDVRGRAEVRLARGDLEVTQLGGGLQAAVISGDLRLQRVRGDVRLDVKRGDVTAADVDGTVEGRLISGDVTVRDCDAMSLDVIHGDVSIEGPGGAVRVATKSGDVEIRHARSRDVGVRTLSGDVAVDLVELTAGTVTVETISGDIELFLPGQARATIDAATRSGDVRSGLPLSDQVTGPRTLRGTLNGAGAAVKLQATSGDIRIRERS